jgi:hypothetical protein
MATIEFDEFPAACHDSRSVPAEWNDNGEQRLVDSAGDAASSRSPSACAIGPLDQAHHRISRLVPILPGLPV